MLKVFRDNLKSFSWVLWVVIIVFVALVFVEVGLFDPSQGNSPDNKAAWAQNGDLSVTFGDYEREFRSLESFYRQIYRDQFTPELADQLKLQALNRAIDREILLQEADQMGLSVTDRELQKAIREVPWLQDENGRFIGREKYIGRLQRSGFGTPGEFEALLREDLLYQKLQEVLQQAVYVSDAEVERIYRDQAEKAKVRYLTLPLTQFASQVTVEQADLESYFNAHAEEYRLPEQRVASYLLVDNNQLRNQAEVTDAAISEYYTQHPDEFTQEEQVRARHILLQTEERTPEEAEAQLQSARQQIEGGRDFSEVAQEISEDPGSRDRGGDLSFFGRGTMTPAFEEAAFNAEGNELVGPFRTPFGVHLLQVTDRREGGLRPLEEVSTRIRNKLITDQAAALAEEKASELLARLNSQEAPPEEAFQTLDEELDYVTLNTTPAFSRQDLIPGIGRSAEFSEAAFTLEAGKISEPIKVPRGWTILTVKEVVEPRLPELSEVEARVRQAALREKQQAAARERIRTAREELTGGGKDLDQLAAELGVDVQESEEFSRGGTIPTLGDAGAQLVEQALSLEEGAIGEPVEGPVGVTLFQVAERKHWDPQEFAEQKEETRATAESEAFQRLATARVEQRKQELNVQLASQIVQATQGVGEPAL